MQDSSRDKDPDRPERTGMSSATSTKRHLISLQREEDEEHRPCDPKKTHVGSSDLNQKENIQENAVVNVDFNYLHQNIHLNENLIKDYLFCVCPMIPEITQLFPTDNIHDGNEQIQQVNDRFKKQTEYQDKTTFCRHILKLNPDMKDIDVARPGKAMQSLLENQCEKQNIKKKKHKGHENQFAFAILIFQNSPDEILPVAYPVYANNNPASSITRHSEECLIKKIKEYPKKDIQIIFIYSYYSPCCKREKNIEPCMFQLLDCANQWCRDYGIITVVAFTKFYGLSGPNFFKDVTFSNISPGDDLYPYIETFKEIPFSLDCEDLRRKINNFYEKGIDQYLWCVKATDREKLKTAIRSIFDDLIKLAESNSVCLREKHLDDGFEIINSFPFGPKVKVPFCEIWKKVVDNSSPIRDKITTDFNTGIVKLFVNLRDSFGNHSPLHLYQLIEE